MIVDCAVYRDGKRLPGDWDPARAFGERLSGNSFVWIGLYEPTDEEFESVRRIYSLHELAVEDAIKAHQRPKLERFGDSLFLVLKTVRYIDREEVIETGEILIFLGDRFIIVVRHGEASSLTGVRKSIEAVPELLAVGPSAVLHAIVDRVVDDYTHPIDGLAVDIDELEEQVFALERGGNPAERIYYLKREVLEFHRAVAPLVTPLGQLASQSLPNVADEVRSYFRNVHDHVLRANEQIDSYRDLLTSILEAHLAQLSIRQNEDMRKISAWVAIAVVPTVVGSIYGMNFQHMPELTWTLGYPVSLTVVATGCSLLYLFFKRRGWL